MRIDQSKSSGDLGIDEETNTINIEDEFNLLREQLKKKNENVKQNVKHYEIKKDIPSMEGQDVEFKVDNALRNIYKTRYMTIENKEYQLLIFGVNHTVTLSKMKYVHQDDLLKRIEEYIVDNNRTATNCECTYNQNDDTVTISLRLDGTKTSIICKLEDIANRIGIYREG